MSIKYKAPRGTRDTLPDYSFKIQAIEELFRKTVRLYGFKEIRTPTFEHTELFLRTVGTTTDVVNKEMYTFLDKGKRSITLKPEGTAGVIRAVVENAIYNHGVPIKVYYISPCYRYEKPQAGRLRQFHQFGVELLAAKDPIAEAEVISLARDLFQKSGIINNISLDINSIGCENCRTQYNNEIKKYFKFHEKELCETCRERLNKNPLRIFDCKNINCQKIATGTKTILEFLCTDCLEHFENLKKYLKALNIEFVVNPRMVRGLDYYTKTVFEFIYKPDKGENLVLCGGGRYDNLVEDLGGLPLEALGFGIGIERLMLVLEKESILSKLKEKTCDLYIVNVGTNVETKVLLLCKILRAENFIVENDLVGKSVKAQMKYANKIKSKFVMVIGEEEITKGRALLKYMATGEQISLSIDQENFYKEFSKIYFSKIK